MLPSKRGVTTTTSARKHLKALDATIPEVRPLACGLHWAMASLHCHYATLHQINKADSTTTTGKSASSIAELVVGVPSIEQGGALFNFLSDEVAASLSVLATKTAALGRTVVAGTRGTAPVPGAQLPGSAVCVPLLDQDRCVIGTLTLLSNEQGRPWPADEQALLATAAPLFGLHLTRARLAEQAMLLNGAMTADEHTRGKQLAEHAAKVVHEMRGVHAGKLKQQREEYRAEVRSLVDAHAKDKQSLEAQLRQADERIKAAEADAEGTRRDAAVRIHPHLMSYIWISYVHIYIPHLI